MIPKTEFMEILENIHKNTDWRYGQIIYNALADTVTENDTTKVGGLRISPNTVPSATMFDFFYVTDEDFTQVLKDMRDTLKKDPMNAEYKWID